MYVRGPIDKCANIGQIPNLKKLVATIRSRESSACTEHNNMAQFEPALVMKWVFKTSISVWLISNTFDIVMGVFALTQEVVASSSGITMRILGIVIFVIVYGRMVAIYAVLIQNISIVQDQV